ncbi:MAG: 50S ribosomal protein L18 [Candidatus Diapherotrites archaeon]|nr:50S ribosomal protein L18 [Candidatus Diapherotrites archaeon]
MKSRRQFKRRLKGRTNYKKRLALVKSRKTRFVIRRSSNTILIQAINFGMKGDHTITGAMSRELSKLGWKAHTGNIQAAYLTGLLCAKKAKEKGTTEGILDLGLATPVHGNAIFAALKGLIDGGIQIPANEEVFPAEEILNGTTTAEWAKKLEKEKYDIQFSEYNKKGFKVETLPKHFEEIKAKIVGK